jgi:hypothetical protein
MSSRILEFEDFLEENLGKVMFAIGILSAIFGIFVLNGFGSLASAAGLFFGFLMIVYGLFVMVGFFYVKWRSIGGLGTVLVCIAVGLFSLAVVALEFQVVTVHTRAEVFKGAVMPFYRLSFSTSMPLMYLFAWGSQVGLIFLLAGVVCRVLGHFRQ